ncbi:MAG: PEP-CTERM sorting domain-containing protein [Pseudomonadota bacterium]
MHTNTRRAVFATALLAFAASAANADLIDGNIVNDDQDLFSFYQPDRMDMPFFFEDDTPFEFDFDAASGIVSLTNEQLFLLENADGDSGLLLLSGMSLNINDGDGFLGGTLTGSFDGEDFTILFNNENIDGTPFNTTTLENGVFSAFLSGTTLEQDGRQMNFAFTGVVGDMMDVAEPSVLALLAFGGLAFGFSRRK